MNAPAPRRALERRSTLLVDWRAEDAALTCRTGQVAAFTRASTGDAATSVGTVTLPSGLPRFSMIDTDGAGGVDTLALRVDKTSGGRAVEVVAIPLLFTLPANFTVYVKHAPDWYATAGALAAKAYLFTLGNAAPRLSCYRSNAAGTYVAEIDTASTDASASVAAPVTRVQEVAVQFSLLTAGGKAQIDAGAGLGTLSSAATAISALGSNTLYLGCFSSTGNELDGGVLACKIASGLYTLDQMRVKT